MKHRRGTIRTVDGVTPAPLTGFTVGVTGHRRWEEQAEMLSPARRRGRPRRDHGDVAARRPRRDARCDASGAAEPVDTVVLTTGIGTRSWFAAAESAGFDDALRRPSPRAAHRRPGSEGPARGPGRGPGGRVGSAGGDERRGRRQPRRRRAAGRRLVVQRDGASRSSPGARGGRRRVVVDVPIYRWHLPADRRPRCGCWRRRPGINSTPATFTSAHAVHNAFELAPDPAAWPRP